MFINDEIKVKESKDEDLCKINSNNFGTSSYCYIVGISFIWNCRTPCPKNAKIIDYFNHKRFLICDE